MIQKYYLLIVLALGIGSTCSSQDYSTGCEIGSDTSSSESITAPSCSKSSPNFATYNNPAYYTSSSEFDFVKTLKINIIFIRDDNGNFNFSLNNNAHQTYINNFYTEANNIMSGNTSPTDPCPGITDFSTKNLTLSLKNTYYLNSSAYFDVELHASCPSSAASLISWVKSNVPSYSKSINVIFIEPGCLSNTIANFTGTWPQYDGTNFTACQDGITTNCYNANCNSIRRKPYKRGCGQFPNFNDLNSDLGLTIFMEGIYTAYLVEHEKVGYPLTWGYWTAGLLLAHEIGHNLDLRHPKDDDLTDTPYSDSYGGFNTGCDPTVNPAPPYDPCVDGSTCTNNLMSYSSGRNYLSPQQLGRVHRSLAMSSTMKAVDGCPSSSSPLTLTADETWDFRMRLYNDIIIPAGKTLTIKCLIEMPDLSKIIVQRGGKLIIDGGTVTNICNMWIGVELWGNSAEPQSNVSSTGQGQVIIINGGTIENARDGITTTKKINGEIDWSYTGGIVQCGGSTTSNTAKFKNCRRGVEFLTYHNITNSVESNNISFFNNTTFEITGPLINSTVTPISQVSMLETRGIKFENNTTFQSSNSLAIDARGKGIVSIDAIYTVSYTNFNEMYYGIDASSANNVHYMNVQNSSFNKNFRGIYSLSTGGDIIKLNTFPRIPIGQSLGSSYGIYMDGARNFLIEQNTFNSDANPPSNSDNYGVIVNNCGSYTNKVWNNKFYNTLIGVQTQGSNGSTTSNGLHINCNSFSGMTKAWNINPLATGSLRTQGICGSTSHQAFNTFSDASTCPTVNHIQSGISFIYTKTQNHPAICKTTNVTYPSACSSYNCATCGAACTERVARPHNQKRDDSAESLAEVFQSDEPAFFDDAEIFRDYLRGIKSFASLEYLNGSNSLESKLSLISAHLKEKNFNAVEVVLNSIKENSEEEIISKQVFGIIYNYARSGQRINQISEQELLFLQNVAVSNLVVSSNAKAIIKAVTNIRPEEIIDVAPDQFGSDRFALNVKPKHSESLFIPINIYPNPTSSEITISISQNEKANNVVQLHSQAGVVIRTIHLTSNHQKIDFNGVKSGIYFLKVLIDGNVKHVHKLSIIR